MNMALRVSVAFGALVLSAFTVGCGSDEPGMDPGDGPEQSLTDAELVACSEGIGLGTITKVEDTKRAEEVSLSLAMEEWLKPSADPGRKISFATASASERGERQFRVGERVLFVLQEAVSNHQVFRELPDPTSAYSAQGMGEEIRQILRRDTGTPCPSFWGQ